MQARTLIRRGESVRWEEGLQLGKSDRRTVLLGLFPSVDAQGNLQQIILSGLDITDRKDAEARLEATAQTFRQMVDHSPFGIFVVDADFRLVRVSEGGQKVFGERTAPVGRDFADIQRDLWPEPYASEIIARFRHTLATGEPYQAPSRLERRADNGAAETYDWRIERITLPDGRPGVACHFYDLSERQRHEEHVKLLMHELNHRSKNMLSLVQAIARQTAAGGTQAFVRRFGQRLRALAASQDLLVRHAWASVPVEELVRSQFAHLCGTSDERVALDGPPLRLSVAAAQALGLALHELATNATKYGALSVEGGHVKMTWGVVTEEDDAAQFFMTWEEHDGPPVAEPNRRGFGTTVITRMVEMNLGGSVALDYAQTGIVWRMKCPAAKVIEGDPRDGPPELAGRQAGGRRVLVVEDELLVATEIGRSLSEAGFDVIGPVRSVDEAMTALEREGCDLGVLDVNLGNETSEEIARELAVRKTPFVVVSGMARKDVPPALRAAPQVPKPVDQKVLLMELERRLDRRGA
jgi:PAS domain S-box-containing protein